MKNFSPTFLDISHNYYLRFVCVVDICFINERPNTESPVQM